MICQRCGNSTAATTGQEVQFRGNMPPVVVIAAATIWLLFGSFLILQLTQLPVPLHRTAMTLLAAELIALMMDGLREPARRGCRTQRRRLRRAGSRRRGDRACHHPRRATPPASQPMRILVTGARGKVGAATIHALVDAGHEVTAATSPRPVYEGGDPGAPLRAGRSDRRRRRVRGRARARRRHPRAAIPDPQHHPAHTVFSQQPDGDVQRARGGRAAGRAAVRERLERDGARASSSPSARSTPRTRRSTRTTRSRPQDPYALAKLFGEQLMDAAVRRSDIRCDLDPARRGCSGRATTSATSARGCATRAGQRELLELHRRLRPRGRAAAGGRERPARARGRCTSPRPTTAPAGRWPS